LTKEAEDMRIEIGVASKPWETNKRVRYNIQKYTGETICLILLDRFINTIFELFSDGYEAELIWKAANISEVSFRYDNDSGIKVAYVQDKKYPERLGIEARVNYLMKSPAVPRIRVPIEGKKVWVPCFETERKKSKMMFDGDNEIFYLCFFENEMPTLEIKTDGGCLRILFYREKDLSIEFSDETIPGRVTFGFEEDKNS
jgi:hypothetical protein